VSDLHRKRHLPPLAPLPAFEAAARHQSFSRAAEELHLTHGAISRAVAQLEQRLGVQLFVRRHRRVYLTLAGERFQRVASEMLDRLDETAEALRRHEGSSPILTISCEPSLGMRWLMPRLGAFRTLNPDLNIDLRLAGGPIDLLADGCDAAIRHTNFVLPEENTVTRLWAEYAGPVCAPDCWETVIGRDLSRARWLHSRTRPEAWREWQRESGYCGSPSSEQFFDHFFFALQAAVDRLGTAIGPLPLVNDDLQAERLIAPLGMVATGYDYVLLTKDSPDTDPRIVRFSNWLIQQAKDLSTGTGRLPSAPP